VLARCVADRLRTHSGVAASRARPPSELGFRVTRSGRSSGRSFRFVGWHDQTRKSIPFGSQYGCFGSQTGSQVAKNPKASARLRPIIHAYLLDLAKVGAYGKGEAGVMRHFIEAGIIAALQGQVIPRRDVRDFGESLEDEDEEN
jgi:hypothetical protein